MLIKVRVTTDARAEKVVMKKDDLLLVSVREPAERNQANKRVIEIIRGMHKGKSVKLVSGHHKSGKIIEIGSFYAKATKDE